MRRLGVCGTAVSAGLFVAAFLAGCGSTATSPTTSPQPATSAASSPDTAPPTATPSAPDSLAADWKTFTTSDGQLLFDYPAEWTIKDRAAEAPSGGAFAEVLTAAGKPLATLRTNVVTGAECTQKSPYSLLDSQPVPALAQQGVTPRFVFESRSNPSATDPRKVNVFAYGITSAPEPSGPEACPIFQFFTWPPSGAAFGGAYNPFDTTPDTTPGNSPNVDTPEAYKQTSEYQDIRKMITSLRPAGT
ncbi:hypothetical protein [Pseudarthrobacter sp. S9]|uniref:hypothetical protein n=1 Tax=Pseudarthrobacter sp. S9 TaxID=3418421 RepID=UPI003D072EF0